MGQKEDIVKTENKIIVIRDKQVILDRDVAELYGVETKEVNKAVRNNPDKFPDGYIIELTNSEKEGGGEKFPPPLQLEIFSCHDQGFHGKRLVYACHHPQIPSGNRSNHCHH